MVGRWYTTRREVVPSRFLKGHSTSLQRCPIYSHPQLLAGCIRSGKLGSSLQHSLQCHRSSACSSTCSVGLCQMLWQSLRLPHRCVISAGLGAWTNPGGLARVECRRIGTSWSHGCSGLMLQTCQGVLLCGSRWHARGAYMVHTSGLQVCNFLVRSQPLSWRSVIHTQISMLGVSVRWLRNAWICRPIWEPILHWVPLAGGRVPRLVLRLCLGLDLGVVWLHLPLWSPIAQGVDNLGLRGPCRLMGHRNTGWTQSRTDCLIFLTWWGCLHTVVPLPSGVPLHIHLLAVTWHISRRMGCCLPRGPRSACLWCMSIWLPSAPWWLTSGRTCMLPSPSGCENSSI